jgi:hypothetical protein
MAAFCCTRFWCWQSSGVDDGVIVRVACHVGRRFEVSRMAVSRDVCFRHHFLVRAVGGGLMWTVRFTWSQRL